MTNLPELRLPSLTGSTEVLKDQQVGFDILKCILRHKSLCALGIIISLVLGSLYYAQQTPIYESSAKILIVNKRPETVGGGTASYFNDYMSTHQALVVSPVVVERAIQKEGISNIGAAEVINGLRVSGGTTGQGANNILTLSFRGKVPAECVTVVNAVLASYQDFLEETYNNMSTNTLELMSEARDTLLVELRQQEEDYRKFREASPLISSGDESQGKSRLALIQAEQAAMLMKKTELKSHLETIQKAKDEHRSPAYISELIANLSANSRPQGSGVALTESEKRKTILLPLLQQEKQLLQSFGSNHPAVTSIQLRIRDAREQIENPERDVANASNSVQYVEYLNQELDRVATVQELLTPIYDDEFAVAKELTSFELRDEEFKRNMSRTQQLYDGVISQLQDAKLSKDYGGFKADIINPPQFGRKVEPRLSTVMLSSLVLGCMFGALLAFIADLIDNGFDSADELRGQINLPVIGHIPQFIAANPIAGAIDSNVDSSLSAFHAPRSAETEAYRGLRTGLYFSNRGHKNKVIQITSPCPGDGKSTIASNLSVCIAQSSKKVLLIDADMRRPRQHIIFGSESESESGLSTVIALDQEITDAVIESPINNLWILPAGPLPPDPAELLTSAKFGELINSVREKYDYVIVDTGPLLAISDPSIVSSQVDGVILAVRLKKTRRKQVSRAKDILESLNAPVIGIVANAIVSSSEAYGYYYYSDYNQKSVKKKKSPKSAGSRSKITAS